jgi:DNA polymerase III delta prime subunit
MPIQEQYTAYQRLMRLMDCAASAIERKDLQQAASVEQQVVLLTSEIESLFRSAVASGLAPEAIANVKTLIEDASGRVTENQISLAKWIGETGAELGRLQQGAVAARSYDSSGASSSPLFEQHA